MKSCILVHGIHTAGPGPVAGLKPYLSDFEVFDPDYGYILGVETKRVNPIIVGCLMPFIRPGNLMICHSNGCAIAYELMKHGCPIEAAVFINAALDSRIIIPPQVKWIDVYYNQDDSATVAAKWGQELGLFDAVWGSMGHDGYQGTDPRVTSVNCQTTIGEPVVRGHSEFFMPANLAQWAPFLVKRIASHP